MNRPLAISRQDHILNSLDAAGSVSVSVLAERLGVSRETIRRDLKALADQGRANLVHGGAARGPSAEPSLAAREAANASGKAAIGRKAASFIEEGMVVLLDSGSTTLALASALVERKDLTVLTNSLPIALLLCRSSGVRVTMLGGEIDANDEAAFGVDTLSTLQHFRVDLVFIGVGGISVDGEFTDYSRLAAEQRHMMMKAGQKVYVVADHTKFERRTPVRMAPVAHIAGLIVDKAPSESVTDALAARHWPIILAGA
ncbi:transcriptional regulator, DeoR family [Rhizobiales bacterium GAS191]|jgi:DeoR family glycerol-3-phosphate regulon repressor|nr:transcriptional regulator, DeoR family [Rhizobiales bacterium GAS113]SEE19922.1 transcriptional regulator, DeoR family [Rhizobiales bacterium GAS188]SEE36879.1 transcriptional regulator, DeoR family [Rhizobiales bacterium GAS191]